MATELLDVIDTIVKIGLGGTIAGISTFHIGKQNSTKELKKEIGNRKLNIIESAVIHADEFINALKTLVSMIDGVRKKHPTIDALDPQDESHLKAWKAIKKYDDIYCDARSEMECAASKLNIIGLSNSTTILVNLRDLDIELRDKVIFNKTIPTVDEIEILRKNINKSIQSFHKELSKHYTYEK